MRILRGASLVALMVSMLAAWLAPPASAERTIYRGQFLCDDRGTVEPLGGMTVQLWKRGWDWLPVEISGGRVDEGFTKADGTFRLTSTPDDDNYFVRMALRDGHGVRLKDFWGINDWSIDIAQMRNDRPIRDYGGQRFSTPGQSHKCAIWAGVHNAYEEYRTEVGSELPTRGVLIEADAVTAGVPLAPHTSIWWPGGFPVGYGGGGDDSITRHEFGHVIRHGFDGDLGHFLGDVVTHNYLQTHEVCNHTGFGFAFNEGWAEYWARDFAPAPDCGRPGDMETEGNVAAALQDLENKCAPDQRRLLVETLRANPGVIHSFEDFRVRFGCPAPPPVVPAPVVAKAATATIRPFSYLRRLAGAAAEARATNKAIDALQRKLKAAVNLADQAPAKCSKPQCLALLRTLTRPAGLEMELELARLHLDSVNDFDSKREQKKLEGTKLAKLIKAHKKEEARERRATVRIAIEATDEVLAAARPVFRSSASGLVKEFQRDMQKALAGFRRAAKGGKLPASLTLLPEAVPLPRKVKRIPATEPQPGPTTDQRVASSLTIDQCPAGVTQPKPIEVAGKLTPAAADSEVKVTFTHPPLNPAVVTVKTDANGEWKASHQQGMNDTGPWSVDASFAGDSARKPSSAQTCQTTVN
jgi:hypothetical protein